MRCNAAAKEQRFAWTCDGYIDVLQVFVTSNALPDIVSQEFYSQSVDATQTLYGHKSRAHGKIPSGLNLRKLQTVLDIDAFRAFRASLKFCAGLCLNQDERMQDSFALDCSVPWTNAHPSEFLKNIFMGYRWMDLRGLTQLKLQLNNLPWLDLNAISLGYLDLAGVFWFPIILHPLRLDTILLSARWFANTYPEIDHVNVLKWESTQDQVQNLYNNQTPEARLAVYTAPSNDTLVIHKWMTPEFRELLQNTHSKGGQLLDIELPSPPKAQ